MFLSLLTSFLVGSAIGGAAVAVGCGIYCIIDGIIDKLSIKEKCRAEGINNVMLNKINKTKNLVNFTDLCTGKEYTCEGDEIGNDIYEGQVITV